MSKKTIVKLKYDPTINPQQMKAHSARERYVLYGGAWGGGKGHPDGTKILTPFGWEEIQNLCVGDVIYSQYNVTEIEGVYHRGKQECYRFTFNDGSNIEVDGDHLWKIQTFRDRMHGNYDRWRVLPTKEIIKRWGTGELKDYHRFVLPKVSPIEFPTWAVILDGYLMGVLLGDGCLTGGMVRLSTSDNEILELIGVPYKFAGKYDYRLPNLMTKVRMLGLCGKHSYDKFIPDQYLWNNSKVRLSVLQGLMDTDGYIDNRSHTYFDSTSERLAKDVKFIVESLGGRATLTSKDRTFTYKGKKKQGLTCYELYIRTDFCPFRLKRKAEKFRERPSGSHKIIRSIEPMGIKETTCLKIKDESGLYVAQDFIVTHNTAMLINEIIQLSLDYPGNRGFIGCRDFTDFRDNAMLQLIKFLPQELYLKERGGVHHQTDHYIRLNNGSVIMYGGLGNDIEAVKAISNMPELGWFAIDQAEQITENQFLLLCGRLRLNIPGIMYKGLLTANPEPGWLRERFIENKIDDHIFIPALAKDNPCLPEGYVEGLRKQYRNNPDMVKRMLEGDWDVTTGTKYLIPYSQIRAAVNRKFYKKKWVDGELVVSEEEDNQLDKPIVFGVDVAYFGHDESVLIARRGDIVIEIDAWSKQDTQDSSGITATWMRKYNPIETSVDYVGYGAGAFDDLNKAGFSVRGVNVGELALDKRLYVDKRAEYYALLAKKFEDGTISIPDHLKLTSQLSSITFDYHNTRMRITPKKQMEIKHGHSPDYADALMLAFINADMDEGNFGYIPVTYW